MATVDERQQRLLTALASAAESLTALDDAQRTAAAGGVELLEEVVAYVQPIIEQTDGELITDAAINAIETHANAIAQDPAGTSVSSRGYADALIAGVSTLPIARDRPVEQVIRESAANFQRSATRRLNSIETEAQKTLTTLTDALTTLRTDVEAASTSSSEQIEARAATFEGKITELETVIVAQQQRIDAMVERQSDAFTESQQQRTETFEGEAGALIKKSTTELDEHMSEIRRMEEESSGLVHSIGLGATAERYGDEAKAQKSVADGFRWITLFFALGAVGVAVFAVVHQVNDNSTVLSKLAVSAVLGGLATYTAKQSGRHRKREERARNLQLELTAFAPFIEPLDDNLKELERVVMTRKTFGNTVALPDEDTDHQYGLGQILDLVQKKLAARVGVDPSQLHE